MHRDEPSKRSDEVREYLLRSIEHSHGSGHSPGHFFATQRWRGGALHHVGPVSPSAVRRRALWPRRDRLFRPKITTVATPHSGSLRLPSRGGGSNSEAPS